jgi:hypothetical protein
MMRLGKPALIASVALLGALSLTGATASAEETRLQVAAFGSPLSLPTGITVDSSNGNVYVVDGRQDGVVKIFGRGGDAPAGGRPSQILAPGGEPFSFGGETAGIAIDNSGGISDGAVYIDEVQKNVVDKFMLNASHEYEYVCQFTGYGGLVGSACLNGPATPAKTFSEPLGLATDSDGNVYVADYGSVAIHEFDAAGDEVASFASELFGRPEGLALDSAGDLYVESYSKHNLVELVRNPSGEVTSEIELMAEGVTGVAVDRSSGRIFADMRSSVEELNAAHETIRRFGTSQFGGSRGLALDEAADSVYVTDPEHGSVDEYGAVALAPDLVTGQAGELGVTTAALAGTVNPDGVATSYHFQYGESPSYDLATPPVSAGAGVETVEAHASLTGLHPLTTYHYRLVAENENGANYGSDMTFATLPQAPTVNDSPPSVAVTRATGLVSGTVNAENDEGSFRVEYIDSAGYEAASQYLNGATTESVNLAASGSDQVAHVAIFGLKAGTTYHYRLVAVNRGGTTYGPDYTFTTSPATPPVVSTLDPSEVTQTTATIFGSVGAQGLQTSYEFELGTDASYSGAKIFGNAGQSAATETVVVNLENLVPGVTYHYRLVATNEDGTSYGTDRSFTTPSAEASISQPSALALIATPAIAFPPSGKVVTTKRLSNAKKLANALKACKKKPKRQRAGCMSKARKRYAKTRKRK